MIKNRFKLTKRELLLAVSFAIMGFFFSLKIFIQWLDSLNPVQGLVIYYIILYSVLIVLSKLGLTIFGLKIERPLQILGLGMITFAFFMIVNWESAYVNIALYGDATNVSQAYFASEDGAMWFFFYDFLGIKIVELARILTFVVMPFVFALIGGYLLERKPKFTQ